MTPRELDTLETILRDVMDHNRRTIVDVNFDPVVMTVHGKVAAADIVIDRVVFAPERRESA